MMKKRVLMPLMMAGMMLASLVALDSCKKSEPQQSLPSIFETGEAPMVDTVIYGNRDLEYICPYCNASIPPNTTEHWHAFGTPPCSGYSGPTPYAVDYCTSALSGSACPYSGIYEHDENAIALMMSTFHIDREAAIARLKPRFHGHNLSYILSGDNGGQHNAWHVGGGVPFWPCP